MADPRLKRKFTTRDAYNLVMRQTQEAREDARAWKVALGLADLMGGSNYRGSSAQARNNAMGERAQKLVSGSSLVRSKNAPRLKRYTNKRRVMVRKHHC